MIAESYVEQKPILGLGELARVVWIHRVGTQPYVQNDLPTGGIELHCVLGSEPRIVGPLTGPSTFVLAPGTTMLGVRFRPGAAALLGLPAVELVDLTTDPVAIWGSDARMLGERLALAGSADAALAILQDWLVSRRATAAEPDRLVGEAIRRLMPWCTGDVGSISSRLAISESQLRRRCLASVGVGPKALHRILRFQGFLALAQSAGAGDRPEAGLSSLAAEAGYADQAHLSRECVRLSGLPPRAFLGDIVGRCACGHDHSASYLPLLRGFSRSAGVGVDELRTRRRGLPGAVLAR